MDRGPEILHKPINVKLVLLCIQCLRQRTHDDVIKWKHFPRNWPFVWGIHRSPVNSPHKGQWRGALMFSLICVWINDWVNNREAGDVRRYCAHYDVNVMNPPARGWQFWEGPVNFQWFFMYFIRDLWIWLASLFTYLHTFCAFSWELNHLIQCSVMLNYKPDDKNETDRLPASHPLSSIVCLIII